MDRREGQNSLCVFPRGVWSGAGSQLRKGVEDPPLRAFSRVKHRLILFDEASTYMVLKNKRLFQAPNTPVIVGSSPTNALAYSVYLGDTLLVVSSNEWERELSAMPDIQRDWLVGNMVFVSVQEKLYLEN